MTLFEEYADNHAMSVYGDASQQLRDLAEAHHMTGHVTWGLIHKPIPNYAVRSSFEQASGSPTISDQSSK